MLYNSNMWVESLGQSHAGSLVGSSTSVIPYGLRIVDSVGVSCGVLDSSVYWLQQSFPTLDNRIAKLNVMFDSGSLHLSASVTE